MKLTVAFQPQVLDAYVNGNPLDISTGTVVAREYVDRTPYTGTYSVTPTNQAQVLMTKNLRMEDNVTINPIPSNYGLITWNGLGIRVS